jgi:hypothetical protein
MSGIEEGHGRELDEEGTRATVPNPVVRGRDAGEEQQRREQRTEVEPLELEERRPIGR